MRRGEKLNTTPRNTQAWLMWIMKLQGKWMHPLPWAWLWPSYSGFLIPTWTDKRRTSLPLLVHETSFSLLAHQTRRVLWFGTLELALQWYGGLECAFWLPYRVQLEWLCGKFSRRCVQSLIFPRTEVPKGRKCAIWLWDDFKGSGWRPTRAPRKSNRAQRLLRNNVKRIEDHTHLTQPFPNRFTQVLFG